MQISHVDSQKHASGTAQVNDVIGEDQNPQIWPLHLADKMIFKDVAMFLNIFIQNL